MFDFAQYCTSHFQSEIGLFYTSLFYYCSVGNAFTFKRYRLGTTANVLLQIGVDSVLRRRNRYFEHSYNVTKESFYGHGDVL